jgi:hypothetical protein
MSKTHILVVDDEEDILELVRYKPAPKTVTRSTASASAKRR